MAANDFNFMLTQHTRPLRAFAYSFTKNLDDAEDLYQDTILKALRYIDNFSEGTNMRAWLFTIMRNTFINSYRSGVRRNSVVQTKEELLSDDMILSCNHNAAVGNFVISDIHRMLATLPEQYRIPFVKHFEGFKYEEIAEELQIPLGTIKTRIHAARELLKKQLKPYA